MNRTNPIITLTTDFGLADGYVGATKGVILSNIPTVTLVDIAHDIPPQNVTAAMITLQAAVPYFPPETVHLAVIDPGVGSSRRAIAVKSNGFYFVGPDNGIFTPWLDPADAVIELKRQGDNPVSPTFHGRDVFAPAAARLAVGEDIFSLGKAIDDPVFLPIPYPNLDGAVISGQVIYVDKFGNCYTNIRSEDLEGNRVTCVSIAGEEISWLALYFAEAAPGDLLALINSSSYLEIAINRGSVAETLGIKPGEPVTVKLKQDG